MRFKNKMILFFIFLAIAAFTLYLSSGRIIIYVASKMCGMNISYKSLRNASFTEISFNDLNVIDGGTGLGFFSKYAKMRPIWHAGFFQDMTIGFDLRDVRFIKKGEEKAGAYDTLAGLVFTPFNSRWSYKEISGKVRVYREGLYIKDLQALSDEIKLLFTGTVYRDKTIDSDIVIIFSDKLIEDIPEELSNVVLRDEKDGWKSLSVSLTGDYKAPSIQVSGKLFRLNIGTTSDSKNPPVDF